MKKLLWISFLIFGFSTCSDDDATTDGPDDKTGYEGYTLQWSDEFDEEQISNLNWTYETGDGTDYGLNPGWGNEELQLYTTAAENSFIEKEADGTSALVIQANEEADGSFSSAKLTTEDLTSFRFGKIEASIKLPQGKGLWPAFWMLGDNRPLIDWPGCGEIDIMELIGDQPDVVHGTVHYAADNSLNSVMGSYTLSSGNFSDDYHLFTVDWTPDELLFSVDGTPYHTVPIEDDMKEFLRSFYLILNVAVGGNWPGSPDATTVFPQKMYVDYVRVYSKDDLSADPAPELVTEEEIIGVFVPPSIAQFGLNSTLSQFPDIELNSFGAGGEPTISSFGDAIEGDSSLLFAYPGGNWGGGWFEMDSGIDMSSFANGDLIFSVRQPAELYNAEIKLEATTNSAAVFLVDYSPVDAGDGFVTYTIPISDFVDLDLTTIKIPFALWNPVNASEEWVQMDVVVDNIYWE